jgi:membrane protease YdiL (CAAX protease family)
MSRDLRYGAVTGFAMPTTVVFLLYATGAISLTRSNESVATVAVTALTAVILTPIVEEVFARYLLLRFVEYLAGTWVAVALTGVLFGAGHVAVAAANDALPAALLYAVPGTLAGVLFAGAYLVTRTMWLPIALHAGWNLATNTVFGPDTFGSHRLITVVPNAPAAVSGGVYGTDASVLTSAMLLVVCAVVLTVAWRKGHMTSRHSKRHATASVAR